MDLADQYDLLRSALIHAELRKTGVERPTESLGDATMSPLSGQGGSDKREWLGGVAPLSIYIDPGQTRYLIDASRYTAQVAFRREFPSVNFEPERVALKSPLAGTTLQIVLGGLSIGAGIIASEFLKEFGKKLWEAVEGMLTSESAAPSGSQGFGQDSVEIELRIEKSSVRARISGLGAPDVPRLRDFLISQPHDLYQAAVSVLDHDKECESCKYNEVSVIELPCCVCKQNGGKLRLIDNEMCALDGTPLPEHFKLSSRMADLHQLRDT